MDKATLLYLSLAIIAEVIATSALKASQEFTKFTPSFVVVVGYLAAFYFMTLVVKVLPIGITYAIWSGLGIVLVSIAGSIFYKQTPDFAAIVGMTLIILGVAVIYLFSDSVDH